MCYYNNAISVFPPPKKLRRMVEDCMNKAVDEVKALPDYSTKGEVTKEYTTLII